MTERKRIGIRTQFMVGYSDMLRRVRKSVKAIQTRFFFIILLIGDSPSPLRACELALIANSRNNAVTQRLNRAIRAGYVYKENKRYYLTSSGRLAYEAMCREYDVTMNGILRELQKEAQRRVK